MYPDDALAPTDSCASRGPDCTSRSAALAALLAIVGNVLAVAQLTDSPHAYKVESLELWLRELVAKPDGHEAAAWLFTIGVLMLIPFAMGLQRRLTGSACAWLGAWLVAMGAGMNAVACMTPWVVVRVLLGRMGEPGVEALSLALLGFTLVLDAIFNLLFGCGMVLCGAAQWGRGSKVIGALGVIAGIATVSVVGQAYSDEAARRLAIAGPLWLAWVAASGYGLTASKWSVAANA